jgi:hypothetical protein
MAVYRPTYATRESVKRALDVKVTARNDWQVDDAIQAASEELEGFLHRQFYPVIETRYVDWPNWQATYPWKVYLDAAELADVTVNVPVVTSGGNVIDNADIFWGSPLYTPPYTYFQLNTSTSATFGQGNTPQRDIAITGTYGYWILSAPADVLAAAVSTTSATAITVTGACTVAAGVGDNLLIGSERMLVADKAMASTGQTQQGSGVTSANTADVALEVSDGTQFASGETLQLDAEQVLVTSIAGDVLTVIRAWNGTVLATHSGATIYGLRTLTVERGALGTTAATYADGTAISVHVVPRLVAQLARAHAMDQVLQETGGYSRQQGSGQSKQAVLGVNIPALRDRVYSTYGRKARSRTV